MTQWVSVTVQLLTEWTLFMKKEQVASFLVVIRVTLIHVKTMAFVDESRATSIIANALKNIMEQTVNAQNVHATTLA